MKEAVLVLSQHVCGGTKENCEKFYSGQPAFLPWIGGPIILDPGSTGRRTDSCADCFPALRNSYRHYTAQEVVWLPLLPGFGVSAQQDQGGGWSASRCDPFLALMSVGKEDGWPPLLPEGLASIAEELGFSCCMFVHCSTCSSVLKMRAACSSKMSANYCQTIRRHIPQASILLSLRCEGLTCNTRMMTYIYKEDAYIFLQRWGHRRHSSDPARDLAKQDMGPNILIAFLEEKKSAAVNTKALRPVASHGPFDFLRRDCPTADRSSSFLHKGRIEITYGLRRTAVTWATSTPVQRAVVDHENPRYLL